jgi:hypothetical protein
MQIFDLFQDLIGELVENFDDGIEKGLMVLTPILKDRVDVYVEVSHDGHSFH